MNKCNLCGFLVVRIHKGEFGTRCLSCLSTYIHRAVGIVLSELTLDNRISVYELSSKGALFKYLKNRYKDFTFSEYFDDIKSGEFKNGIQCQNVEHLTYETESFDLVTATEVFEHVPDDLKGYREIYRVLKKEGCFIFTVPLSENKTTVERAYKKDEKIVYILPPEYHGDRIRGTGRVLTFRNYGMDIKNRLESIGFKVTMNLLNNNRYAITNAKVIVCRKELK